MQCMYAPNEDLYISCLPSLIFNRENMFRFGYIHVPGQDMTKVFAQRMRMLLQVVDDGRIVFKFGNGKWTIIISNHEIHLVTFGVFENALALNFYDFAFMSFSRNMEANVVIFTQDGTERIYEWLCYENVMDFIWLYYISSNVIFLSVMHVCKFCLDKLESIPKLGRLEALLCSHVLVLCTFVLILTVKRMFML